MTKLPIRIADSHNRRAFIGGSDARISGARNGVKLALRTSPAISLYSSEKSPRTSTEVGMSAILAAPSQMSSVW